MKKKWLTLLLLNSVFLLGACSNNNNEEQTTFSATESSVKMKPVDDASEKTNDKVDSSQVSETKSSTSTMVTVEKSKKTDNELLQKYGEAYANFSSINDRNEKLKKLMTKECIKKNGIDVKTTLKLQSSGEVTSIYQNDKEEYAVLLDCVQNGSNIRIVLLAKVKDNKISEMTYNTLKQEY
ncbi:lipoprotein [Enterococcus thailandicus]|uniref:EF0163 family protein n=1 Tax=Enterococcus thailandicus TaxID=417368 RepID=UPI00244D8C11|nr:EF0163 family protein [Enterococcus thailandicus]GMC03855.1 lipoprotein [Enterococcus thailandicus]GMC08334.1 lipoprotein [Enterococcus thailandicus]